MTIVNSNYRGSVGYPANQEVPVVSPATPKNQKTINKAKVAALVMSGVAGLAGGAYVQTSLGHPKGLLVTVPLMQLGRIGSEGKVKWLNHPVAGMFILGALAGAGSGMIATGMRDWSTGVYPPTVSWNETIYGMAFCFSCVAAAQVVIERAKAKQRIAAAVKVEAQNVSKAQTQVETAK